MKAPSLTFVSLSLTFALGALTAPAPAEACGGFFCSSTPVDQNAERIAFKVRKDGRTDMIVQISYQGKAEDFAWLLPLAEPPAEEDLGTFPQRALTALDAQTGVVVSQPCFAFGPQAATDAGAVAEDAGATNGNVDVYVRAQIGNYDVAVIGSSDASATADWLETNDFRISDAMLGFIDLYTKEGMKFLALKLLPDKQVTDITPFKLTLPGETPSIPLRLSAVAAEPEMGIVAWIFSDQRYEPANADELTIDDADLRFDNNSYRSNWLSLVARAVDEAQGRGFVVEDAEPLDNLRQFAENSFTGSPEQEEAKQALLDLFSDVTYMTRLYTRLSPEEMTYDPTFRRSMKGDVSRYRSVADNSCQQPPEGDPCDFVACGALGLCRVVESDGAQVAACACADGSTARATFVADASGTFSPTVSCIDKRLSFLNPGDRNAAGKALPDPCVGIDCGGHGTCVAMNMTPTCDCDRGYAAQPLILEDGSRSARCLMPTKAVPDAFYNRRPMPRSKELPVGRDTVVPAPTGLSDSEDPVPEGNMDAIAQSKGKSVGCALAPGAEGAGGSTRSLLAVACGVVLALSRRRSRGRRLAARR